MKQANLHFFIVKKAFLSDDPDVIAKIMLFQMELRTQLAMQKIIIYILLLYHLCHLAFV